MKKPKSDPINFCFYLVAYIDILSQSDALKQLKGIPTTEEGKQEFIRILKKTFGAVDMFRKIFDQYFTESQKETPTPSFIPEKDRKLFDALKKSEVKFQGFSDATIVYVPLQEKEGIVPINGVCDALIACASTFLLMMSAGYACRGGIDVGVGSEMFDGEIYGPALYEAYRLESQVAQYPRIVIGKNLIDYLVGLTKLESSDVTSTFTKTIASKCLSFLVQDIDGQSIVDYLGERLMEAVEYQPVGDGTIIKAYDFVKNEAVKWRDRRDTTLSFRYNLLGNYFTSRLTLWKDRLK
jgi:hypothetical protein